jgi:hypothetical protein
VAAHRSHAAEEYSEEASRYARASPSSTSAEHSTQPPALVTVEDVSAHTDTAVCGAAHDSLAVAVTSGGPFAGISAELSELSAVAGDASVSRAEGHKDAQKGAETAVADQQQELEHRSSTDGTDIDIDEAMVTASAAVMCTNTVLEEEHPQASPSRTSPTAAVVVVAVSPAPSAVASQQEWNATASPSPTTMDVSASHSTLSEHTSSANQEGVEEAEPHPTSSPPPPVQSTSEAEKVSASTAASSSSSSRRSSTVPPQLSVKQRTPAAAAAAAATRLISATNPTDKEAWMPSCRHSDPPARYRDTPAHYCTYCSYTICEDCYALIPASLLLPSTHQRSAHAHDAPSQLPKVELADDCEVVGAASATEGMSWLDAVLCSPATAVRSSGCGGGSGAAVGAAASRDDPRTHRQLFASGPGSDTTGGQSHPTRSMRSCSNHNAAHDTAGPPPLCHLCRRGHLIREEALLFEWCCEGPSPERRLHRGSTLVYDTQNLQTYYFMRAQRDARLTCTAPLQAQMLSTSPAALPLFSVDSSDALTLQQTHQQASPSHRDPVPLSSTASAASSRDGFQHRPTRRTAAAVAVCGVSTTSVVAGPSPRERRCVCEEGGSFVFSVHNPRLEVPLVWCAVNRQPREEAPAYASVVGPPPPPNNGDGGAAVSPSSSSSITPLLLWRCPPSLPGLPARPYRVVVPYGLYAFANAHALTLFVAGDIFRKASAQLVGSPTQLHNTRVVGGWMDGGGKGPQTTQHLAWRTVTPAASLRPLLTVYILHHVATTPRPISLPSLRCKRGRTSASASVALKKPHNDNDEEERAEDKAKVPRMEAQPTAPSSSSPSSSSSLLSEGVEAADMPADADSASQLTWPDGLASPELALCVDHLLHGRSVAVYGIASKFFFLHHVASSAELKSFRVLTVDASPGRVGAPSSHTDMRTAKGGALSGGVRRGCVSAGSTTSSAPSSVMRQLLSVGHALGRRVPRSTTITAAMRAEMTSAADAAADDDNDDGGRRKAACGEESASAHEEEKRRACNAQLKPSPPHRIKLSFDHHHNDDRSGDDEDDVDGGVTRAAMPGDARRSPAMARDATNATLQHPHHQEERRTSATNFVDVDASSNSSVTAASWKENADVHAQLMYGPSSAVLSNTTPIKGTVREVIVSQTPPQLLRNNNNNSGGTALYGGLSPSSFRTPLHVVSPHGAQAPLPLPSQRATQLSQTSVSSLPGVSPIPAFFAALQRSVTGEERSQNHPRMSSSRTPEDNGETPHTHVATIESSCVVCCEEVVELRGALNSLQLPPVLLHSKSSTVTPTRRLQQVHWRPPVVAYATDVVRRHVLQHLRRQHASRRCVQWASLPSTTAVTQLSAQTQQVSTAKASSPSSSSASLGAPSPHTLLLTHAHQTRPGWQPPVLLVLHNVDLLESDEASVLLQLCAAHAFPQPRLQLLLSFDDPLWPLSSVAAALERMGVCAVQLRSLLLPRVHETRHFKSIHLLTNFEAVAATAGGGGTAAGRRRGGRKGLSSSASAGGLSSAAGAATAAGGGGGGGGGTSYLLQDTMRRVLFSLPPAFNGLLRMLLDLQDEVGEGVYISLFTVTERFEKNGVMVSQGRLKALLRELTSNRIARYDSAEHALMVPQVSRLRKALDEVTAQREGRGTAL